MTLINDDRQINMGLGATPRDAAFAGDNDDTSVEHHASTHSRAPFHPNTNQTSKQPQPSLADVFIRACQVANDYKHPRGILVSLRNQFKGQPDVMGGMHHVFKHLLTLTSEEKSTQLDNESKAYLTDVITFTASWVNKIANSKAKPGEYNADAYQQVVNDTAAFEIELDNKIKAYAPKIPKTELKPLITRLGQTLKTLCVGLLNLFGAQIQLESHQDRTHQQPQQVIKLPQKMKIGSALLRTMSLFNQFKPKNTEKPSSDQRNSPSNN